MRSLRRSLVVAITAATVVLVGAMTLGGRSSGAVPIVQSESCPALATWPIFIPATGAPLNDVHFDNNCTHVYASSPGQNRIEVLSLETLSLETPIQVGSAPMGFDITPDGVTMYVANSGGTNISVVDVAGKVELRKITVPPTTLDDTPWSIAIANNGKALFTTHYGGSGQVPLRELDLASEDMVARGSTTERSWVVALAGRTKDRHCASEYLGGPSQPL